MRKYRYRKESDKKFLVVLIIGLIIGCTIGYYYAFFEYRKSLKNLPHVQRQYATTPLQTKPTYSYVEIGLPAVDQDGNGVVTKLRVEAKPGNGKVLTNIDKLLFWVDTQQSIQIAKSVAENVTGINASSYDLIYTIESNATLIGGPSAGAALAIATIAVLENKTIRKDVMMTGTINPDGSIGEVGGVLEKARAAKEFGATLFLVPYGQGTETYLEPEEKCVKRLNFIFCETTYKPKTINIGNEIGISVIEVRNVEEALKYFM
jgi:uncharacterized protein